MVSNVGPCGVLVGETVCVLLIGLFAGNGTQSIVWQINEEAHRRQLELGEHGSSGPSPLRVYYGSIHDPLSYPCEVFIIFCSPLELRVLLTRRAVMLLLYKRLRCRCMGRMDSTLKMCIYCPTSLKQTFGVACTLAHTAVS